MKAPFQLLTAAAAFHLAAADWQFRSRPDLAVPRLNITIAATDAVEPGYLFIAPFKGFEDTGTQMHGPRQAGPYIFKDNGDLVWSGYGIYSIWATNFQAGRWNGKPVLFSFEGDHNAGYGHGHGHVTLMDQHYETIRELRAGNHKLIDKHEFHIKNEETGLVQIYQPVPRDLKAYGASEDQQWIVNAIIQELDISTGKLLFEWASLDHVLPDEAVLGINPGQAGSGYNSSDAWDYFHINSVDKNSDGDYLISARDACAVHKINGSDGTIIWRLNGLKSDFAMADGTKFCFQHHARFVRTEGTDVEVISLYDNSAHGTENGRGSEVHTAPTSSGKVLRLNTTSWTCELVHAYFPPDNLRSKSQGSTQLLPGGHVLVNWGSEGAMTEFSENGKPLFHAYMDSGLLGAGVENYRAFRYNWTGLPNEEPAIVALENDEGSTIYVSWNGDTETKLWRFYTATDGYGSREFLGEVDKVSFETSLLISGKKSLTSVSAEAIDAKGKVLRVSGAATIEPEVLPAGTKKKAPSLNVGGAVEKVLAKPASNWEEYALLKIVRMPFGELLGVACRDQ